MWRHKSEQYGYNGSELRQIRGQETVLDGVILQVCLLDQLVAVVIVVVVVVVVVVKVPRDP
jgi:hypothetical protein